jgi:LuxR family maltose regulon positive regulatory protein
MYKTDPLIRTKLHLPFLRTDLVARPRLQECIVNGLRGPLTLVTAPAGFGKTTAIASCVIECGMPAAWLSLDRYDNQDGRFLTYMISALQEIDAAIGSVAAEIMTVAREVPWETILTSLINNLGNTNCEIVLILDDYQIINSQAVHEQVSFLLEHCPTNFHLVIATRSDPALPLNRLRARGHTVEIRAADLRFSEQEAAQFLNGVMHLQLDDEAIAALEERTEGWAAGLQMAALSLRNRDDIHRFIEDFSGTNRYILDYLVGEVLENQPEEVQQFLRCTSILDRLTAPLCDYLLADKELYPVVGDKKSQSDSPSFFGSTSILNYLEQANLFLVPLDDERIWYRYHHLFADLLVSQLMKKYPGKISALHSRASFWYEQNGWLDQAIEHSFAAEDMDRSATLVEGSAQGLIYKIPFDTMQKWIDQLPEETVLQKAWLGITQGWLWVAKLQLSDLPEWMKKVEDYFLTVGRNCYSKTEQQDILANIASLRAYDAFFKGDLLGCAELSHQALKLFSPGNVDLRARILVQLGETYLILQDLEKASAYLGKAIDAAIELEDFQSLTTASMRLYKTLRTLGRLNKAEKTIRQILQLFARKGRSDSPVASKLEQCWGDLLRERGQFAEAGVQLNQALVHARQYNSPLDIITALIYLGMWMACGNDLVGAEKALEEAEELMHSFTIPPIIMATWSLQRARVFYMKGEYDRAEEYLSDPAHEETNVFKSRLLLKRGEIEKAQNLLLHLEQSASKGQRNGNLIQVLLARTCVLAEIGEECEALEVLTRCLQLAQPQGYRMTFLEEGEPMHGLLRNLQKRRLTEPLSAYVNWLVQAFTERSKIIPIQPNVELYRTSEIQDRAEQYGSLIEPLSQRELEVLHLLSLGRTNQQIAHQLVVAPGTVKAHTSSIYRKLDVSNRTEAVVRARQVGIIP